MQAEPAFGRLRLASPKSGRVLTAATLVALVLAATLSILGGDGGIWIVLIPFAVVGAIVVRRQPHNPVGSILLVLPLVVMLCGDAGQYAVLRYLRGHDWLPLGRVAVFLAPGGWFWLVVLLPLPLALFPDARLTRGWRNLLRAYFVFAAAVVGSIVWHDANTIGARHLRLDSSGQLATFSSSGTSVQDAVTIVLYVAFCLAWVARLVLAYHRSSGDYRQQLKWLLVGGTIGLVGVTLAISTSGGGTLSTVVGGVGFLVGLFSLPVSLGIGILKYRLYDIDRLISRTLSYAVLTALLVAVFAGIVVFSTHVLPFSSPVGVAASTLAAAALFNPLRRRVQHSVDRRFNRSRYDAEATVTAFTMRLRDAVDLDTIRVELLRAVDRAVEPAHASLWLKRPGPPSG
jgi:hypothetical protein